MKIIKLTLISIIACLIFIASLSSGININVKKIQNKKSEELNMFEADVYVDDDAPPDWYDATHVKTIIEGINNATEGNTIFVYNGIYLEKQINIFKKINLIGEDKNSTFIDGKNQEAHVIVIIEDFVNISDFSIKNSGGSIWRPFSGIRIVANFTKIINNIFQNNYIGVDIRNTSNTVSKNLFLNDNIELMSAHNNLISENTFVSNDPPRAGVISLLDSDNNIVHGNIFTGESEKVIYVDNSHGNVIKNNQIKDGYEYGILLFNSRKNDIHHNNLKNNFKGIVLEGCSFNKIHHNNFFNCKIKALTILSPLNIWFRNYWNRPRILPKRVFGIFGKFDFLPRLIPNDIV